MPSTRGLMSTTSPFLELSSSRSCSQTQTVVSSGKSRRWKHPSPSRRGTSSVEALHRSPQPHKLQPSLQFYTTESLVQIISSVPVLISSLRTPVSYVVGKLSILSNGGFFNFAKQVPELLVHYKAAQAFVNCRNVLNELTPSN
ncbi:hypothetical protein F2Q69_00005453 [Brassica cretica]|uniref:Uncharacterized protein n=1 Tax=Brassica cretica TaxID=69181 RepID=A0A8S9PA98_BRACR|nr:hypothetical protein F2Q69_00005453 [Brassica cretica]